ncbi:MAG: hypothetical protein LBK47_08660 [Prevotellaceae bacterium]|nr:hypothetical protein [Prevotellaceae bacterium]
MLTADNSQGTKFDYLPVRCVYGVGEAVAADGAANLQDMGAVSIALLSGSSTFATGQTIILRANVTTMPTTATYKWMATSTNEAPEWVIQNSATPELLVVAPALTSTADGVYNIKVVVVAAGYTPKESSNAVAVTIKTNCTPLSQGAITGAPANNCSGDGVALTGGNVIGGDGSNSYLWEMRTSTTAWATAAGTANSSNYSATAGSEVRYFRRKVTACSGSVSNYSTEVSLKPYPVVIQGTIANQTSCPEVAVTTAINPSVSGGNSNYTYQWQTATTESAAAPTAGFTNSVTTASIQPTAPASDQYLWVRRIAKACGENMADTSKAAYIYAAAGGGIAQTAASATYYSCPGNNLTITLGAATGGSGNTPTYTWYYGASAVACTTAVTVDNQATTGVASFNNNAITIIPNATAGNYTNYFKRSVTSCAQTITTTTFRVYNAPPVTANISGGGDSFCPNTDAAITSSYTIPNANGTGAGSIGSVGAPTYQWQKISADLTSWADVNGATSASYTPKSPSPAGETYYRYVIKFAGCGNATATSARVKVSSISTLAQVVSGGNVSVCSGSTVALTGTVSGAVGTPTFQWQKSTDNINFSNIPSATAVAYNTTANATVGVTEYYRRVATSSCGTAIPSASMFITSTNGGLTQAVTTPTIAVNGCGAGSIDNLTITLTGGQAHIFQWQKSATGNSGWTNVTTGGNSISIEIPYTVGTTASDYYHRVVTSCGVTDTSKAIRLVYMNIETPTIEELPAIYNASTKLDVAIKPTIIAGPTTTYQWETSANLAAWSSVANAANPTITIKTPATAGSYSDYYRLKLTSCGSNVYSNAVRAYAQLTCPYTFEDLVPETCNERTGSEKNWEAYIKDSRDDKQYRIVQLPDGNWWLAQNLNYTNGLTYASAANIPAASVSNTNPVLSEGYYWCPGPLASADSWGAVACETYGALYTWNTIMRLDGTGAMQTASAAAPSGVRGICPVGWHFPSVAEWNAMFNCVEGDCSSTLHSDTYQSYVGNAGKYLKSAPVGTATATNPLWRNNAATVGTDIYGFSALGTGYRYHMTGLFSGVGEHTVWLVSDERGAEYTYETNVNYANIGSRVANPSKAQGGSVRCVRDQEAVLPSTPTLIFTSGNTIGVGASEFTATVEPSHKDVAWTYIWTVEPSGAAIVAPPSTTNVGSAVYNTASLTASNIGQTYKLKVSATAPDYPAIAAEQLLIPVACPYTKTDLITCVQRTDGDKNWEITFKDSRDQQVYRAVQMPDGNWWQADVMKYIPEADTYGLCGGIPIYNFSVANGGAYSNTIPSGVNGLCPSGWHVPSEAEYRQMLSCVEGTCGSGFWTTLSYETATNANISKVAIQRLASKSHSQSNYYGILLSEPLDGWNGSACGTNLHTRNATSTLRPNLTNYMITVEVKETELMFSNGDAFTATTGWGTPLRCVSDYYLNIANKPTVEIWSNAVTANGQQVTFKAKNPLGGTAPYEYSWDGDAWGSTASVTKTMSVGVNARLKVRDATGAESDEVTKTVTLSTCAYTFSDRNASVACYRRGDGENWSAGIIDPRDSRQYDIVQVGSAWWLAQNLDWDGTGDALAGAGTMGEAVTCADCLGKQGRRYSIMQATSGTPSGAFIGDNKAVSTTKGVCPAGWHLPSDQEWQNLVWAMGIPWTSTGSLNVWNTIQPHGNKLKINTGGWTVGTTADPAAEIYGFNAVRTLNIMESSSSQDNQTVTAWWMTYNRSIDDRPCCFKYIGLGVTTGLVNDEIAGNGSKAFIRCVKD